MKNAKRGVERIKKVILQDRTGAPDDVINVLKSDIFDVLDGFFEVNPHSVVAEIQVDNVGTYEIKFSARAFRVRGVRKTS